MAEYFSFTQTCTVNTDCQDNFICNAGSCVRGSLFPVDAVDVVVTLFVCFLNSLGSAAGIAEAGLLTSYLVIFMNYAVKDSIDCGYAIGLGGAIGNFLNVAFLRHPETKRPVINYEINLIVIPMLMFGVYIGVNIQRVAPTLLIIILLFLVLFFTFYKFFNNFRKQREKEKITQSGVSSSLTNEYMTQKPELNLDIPTNSLHSTKELESTSPEHRLFPWEKYREVLLVIIGIVAFGLLRGGQIRSSPLGIPYCGVAYWLALLVILGYFLLLFWRNSRLVMFWQAERQERGVPINNNELEFDKAKVIRLGLLACMAGTLGATIAIGGALILTPFFLAWGLPPRDTSYTCALFVMMTMFNTTYQQLLFGGLTLDEVLWFGGIAFVMSFTSSKFVGNFVRKTGKQSILLLLLIIVCTFSILMECYVLANEVQNDANTIYEFNSEC